MREELGKDFRAFRKHDVQAEQRHTSPLPDLSVATRLIVMVSARQQIKIEKLHKVLIKMRCRRHQLSKLVCFAFYNRMMEKLEGMQYPTIDVLATLHLRKRTLLLERPFFLCSNCYDHNSSKNCQSN